LGTELQESISNYSEASKLKKVMVQMLSNEMSRDDEKMLREQYNEIDIDGDGMIDIDDLTNFLHKQGGTREEAKSRATLIISKVDQNKDGVVSIEEFKNAKLAGKIGTDETLLRKHFRRIDENNDGFISHAELSKLFNWTLTKELVENMIMEIDINNDGKISYDEFLQAMKHGAIEKAISKRPHITKVLTLEARKELMQEAGMKY